MTVDIADEENGTKPEGDKAERRPATEHQTEWTASDARGPLNEAGPGTERLLPPRETEPREAVASAASLQGDEHGAEGRHAEPIDAAGAVHDPATGAGTASGPVAEAPRPRRSLWPVAAGLIVGALIGAGSAAGVYVYQQPTTTMDQQVASLNSRLDALEKRPDPGQAIASLKSSIADLGDKVAASQKAAADATKTAQAQARAPAFDPAPLQRKIATLQGSLDALRKQGDDVKGLDGKVAGLAAAVAAMQRQDADVKSLDDKVSALATSIAGMQKQGSTARASIDALQTNQKSLEGKITSAPSLAVVADSLVQQVDQGQPYTGQVNALVSLGADPAKIAVLRENAEKGVPSAKVLATKFEPLADPILATEHHAPANAGFMERLKSGFFSMVSIRRADDTTGNDLASRVARIQADLAHDDVAGAFATWDALPAAVKAKSEAWGALAKTHAEAMNAARALQHQAIASLGAKKS